MSSIFFICHASDFLKFSNIYLKRSYKQLQFFFSIKIVILKSVRHGSQIWLQLSAASPTNRPQPKAITIIVIIRLNLWPAAGCEAKLSPHPLGTLQNSTGFYCSKQWQQSRTGRNCRSSFEAAPYWYFFYWPKSCLWKCTLINRRSL